ncbi:DUF2254 family protein [Streptomyces sp. NPDC058412]|uniref:DUF2254 family protein n=1 Tax=Streptomyces sp. NPDC058412 TaxID=3346486 RepID=UPI0036666A3F
MFQRPTRAMRRDLTQLICALGGLALGLLAPLADVGPQVEAGRVTTMLFSVGFGVISLVSIIYSMLFLVVQFSATTFTPRLAFFRDEPIVWRAFAFAVGVFVFCVVAGLGIGTRKEVAALLPCIAMILTLIALAQMRTLQTKAFDSIQLAHSLTAIATRAHRSYDSLHLRPYVPGRTAPAPPPPGTGATSTVRWSGPATVVQQIDVHALVAVAQRHDCAIDFRVAPGLTVSRGMVLAEVTGAELAEEVVREAVITGVERTFDQDPELPFRLLVDIALRALSPAVNDPATAVETVGRLEDLLTRLADRELDFGRFTDGAGRVRVTVPVPDWEQYVRTSFDDLLFAAANSPMALRRVRDLLGRLARESPESRRAVVRERLEWAERTGSAAYPLIWTPVAVA